MSPQDIRDTYEQPGDPSRLAAALAEHIAPDDGGGTAMLIDPALLNIAEVELHDLLGHLVQFIPDPLVLVDRHGIVVEWNRAMEQLTGVSRIDAIGWNTSQCSIALYGAKRKLLVDWVLEGRLPDPDLYATISTRGQTVYAETFLPRPNNGRGATMWVAATPVTDTQGRMIGAIESLRDITDRKKIEQELLNAKSDADSANRTKTDFLATMSHELRTPLNSIIGFTELMISDESDPPTEKRAKRLEKVHRNAVHLLKLINDILDMSKIDAGRMVLDRQDFSLVELLSEVHETFRDRREDSPVPVLLDIDATLTEVPMWHGDRVRLKQAIDNLVSNAMKFTEHGTVTIRSQRREGLITIDVADTGIGIAEANLSKIFDEFTQVDSSNTRRAMGTGLGLPVTRRLCRMMGGEVTVVSTLGSGTTFTITLPTEATSVIPTAEENRKEVSKVIFCGTNDTVRVVGELLATRPVAWYHATQTVRAMEMAHRVHPTMVWIDPFCNEAVYMLAELAHDEHTCHLPVGLLAMEGTKTTYVSLDGCIEEVPNCATLRRIIGPAREDRKTRVLLFAEHRTTEEFAQAAIDDGGNVELIVVTSLAEANDIARSGPIDCVIFGLDDPFAQGLAAMRAVRQRSETGAVKFYGVAPRRPSINEVIALRTAFQLHLADHGLARDVCIHEVMLPDLHRRLTASQQAAAAELSDKIERIEAGVHG